jgi:hypothetical protein
MEEQASQVAASHNQGESNPFPLCLIGHLPQMTRLALDKRAHVQQLGMKSVHLVKMLLPNTITLLYTFY